MSRRYHSRDRSRGESRDYGKDDRSRYDTNRSRRHRDDSRDRYRGDSRDRYRGERSRRDVEDRYHRDADVCHEATKIVSSLTDPSQRRELFSNTDRRQNGRLNRPDSYRHRSPNDRKRYRDRSSSHDSRQDSRRLRRGRDRSPSPKRSRRGSSLDSRSSKPVSVHDGKPDKSGRASPLDTVMAENEIAKLAQTDKEKEREQRRVQSERQAAEEDRQERERQANYLREMNQSRNEDDQEDLEERLNANRPKRRTQEVCYPLSRTNLLTPSQVEQEQDPWEDPAEAKRKKLLARQAKLADWKAKRLQEMASSVPQPDLSQASTAQTSPLVEHVPQPIDAKAVSKRAEEAISRLEASSEAKTKSAEPTSPNGTKITDLNGKATAPSLDGKHTHLKIHPTMTTKRPSDLSDSPARLRPGLANPAAARSVDNNRSSSEMETLRPMLANSTATSKKDPSASVSAAADDDVDPLDAFMTDLDSVAPSAGSVAKTKINRELVSGNEGAESMDAVGDEDEWPTAVKKKKKEMAIVDHTKIRYEPFRKNFYTEPQELQDLDEEGVKSLRFELDDIQVKGANVPKPVRKFAQFGLGTQVLDIVRKLGFENPTSIQSQAIPTIMSGRDVIGIAKTGSGKTVAFLLPMFRHIKDQRPLENLEGPVSLIVAPTRELATQIHKECQPYLKALNLRAVCAYGGSELAANIAALKRGAEIVVCTPGRMIDLMTANNGRVLNLRRVTYVVLDEADRMYDMGFAPQVQHVLSSVRPDRQMVLFSATFSKQMELLARKSLVKPVQIIVGGTNTVAAEITQKIQVLPEDAKFHRTLELLGELLSTDEDARALIFVERQGSADILLSKLAKSGYPCVSVHGGVDQADRDQFVNDFKSGACPVMIATSVAARGLDVKQLKLVVNYDVPNHLEDYVHRAGRTGRAGATGTAVTFITEEQGRFAGDLVKALKLSSQEVPKELGDLAEAYIRKVKSGEATAAGRGFGGRGLEKIESQRDAERRLEKRAHGVEGDDDEDGEDTKDGTIDIKVQVKARDEDSSAPTPTTKAAPDTSAELNFDFTVQRTERPAPAAKTKTLDSKAARLAAAAAAINSRIGARGTGRAVDNKGPDAGEFHAVLEINDYPQKCRWAVTNRSNVAKVLEMTQASITTKGQYYKPGSEPEEDGPPKMYVLIEGDTERQVDMATRELVRLMKTAAAQEAESSSRLTSTSGRYNVL